MPPLHTQRVDCAEQNEVVDFGALRGMACASSMVGQFTAAAELERRVQWNDLMWPDDAAAWSSSPRHSYLRSCEKQNLMPHPRLLQFPHPLPHALQPNNAPSIGHAPRAAAPASHAHFVAPFGFVARHIYLGDAGLQAALPLIRSVLTGGGEGGRQLQLQNVGITRAGMRLLGQQLQEWSDAPKSRIQVVDADFSCNPMGGSGGGGGGGGGVSDDASQRDALAHSCPIYYLQPILRTRHIRRLCLSGCKCAALPPPPLCPHARAG